MYLDLLIIVVLLLLVAVYFTGASANTTVDCPVYEGAKWSSSDNTKLTIDEDGKAISKLKIESTEKNEIIEENENKQNNNNIEHKDNKDKKKRKNKKKH